jgi:hypothetical protein
MKKIEIILVKKDVMKHLLTVYHAIKPIAQNAW